MTVGSFDSIEIHAVPKAEYGFIDLARTEANIRALKQNPPVEQAGNRIRVGYPKYPNVLDGVSMHLEVQVPWDSQIQALTTSGGIRVDGTQSPLEVTIRSGAISVQGAPRFGMGPE